MTDGLAADAGLVLEFALTREVAGGVVSGAGDTVSGIEDL